MSETTSTEFKTPQTRAVNIRRVTVNSPSQMPSVYSQTPGGTLFSTTPGGTRIIYDRAFLMQFRNSPLAKSPPANLPKIPGVTSPEHETIKENGHEAGDVAKPGDTKENMEEDPQFQMDI